MSTSPLESVSMLAEQEAAQPAELSPDFVDQAQLAARLGVHPRTVRRMVDRGELPRPCLSTGGRPRWLWSHVLEHCQRLHHRQEGLDRRRIRKLRQSSRPQ
jgi:predicted DNA-binding transcriptional regulator AlpA